MKFLEIAVIVACVLIVGGVIVTSVIKRKKGKTGCSGCGCCGNCSGCKHHEEN